jgi:hypothetical protein
MSLPMSVQTERIWMQICSIQSDDVRYQTIHTVLRAPDVIAGFRRLGVYAHVLAWLSAYERGETVRFPFTASGQLIQENFFQANYQQSAQQERWKHMYAAAPQTIQHHTADMFAHNPYAAATQTQTHYQSSQSQSSMVVHPAAKAMDFFQESLELLGIDESESLTHERIRYAYKSKAIYAHPDKGGSKEQFDALRKAFQYIEKIVDRITPRQSAAEKAKMTAAVTMETARAQRENALPEIKEAPAVQLSAKKLNMADFNRLFEENRLPDQDRDTGYGSWLSSQAGSDDIQKDPRLAGKFSQQAFEQVFREKAMTQTSSTAMIKRNGPDALIALGGTELGGSSDNFTAAFGSDTQFTDLKQAYTTGSTVFQEVADVKVTERSARNIDEAKRLREEAMRRVDPDEESRIAAHAAELDRRERERRLRMAKQDATAELWHQRVGSRFQVADR